MAQLVWDKAEDRIFELGVDRGVFFPKDGDDYLPGVVWNGLINVTEKSAGGEDNKQYADNMVYANIRSQAEFEASIEAFTYPDEMSECDGSAQAEPGVFVGQQLRKPFGLSYRTKIGNNNDNLDFGYKVHLVWGATPEPTEKSRDTINDSPEASTFTWDIKTERVPVVGLQPTAHIWVDSTKATEAQMTALETMLYGDETEEPSFPTPDAVLALFTGA
jgi:hypothetical protein